jgi:hypothetical protein
MTLPGLKIYDSEIDGPRRFEAHAQNHRNETRIAAGPTREAAEQAVATKIAKDAPPAPKKAAQLDAEIATFLAERAAPGLVGAGVLAGAYKGKDIAERVTLIHAASTVPVKKGRFSRQANQAFCRSSIDIVDPYGYAPPSTINCPACLEIVARLTRS